MNELLRQLLAGEISGEQFDRIFHKRGLKISDVKSAMVAHGIPKGSDYYISMLEDLRNPKAAEQRALFREIIDSIPSE